MWSMVSTLRIYGEIFEKYTSKATYQGFSRYEERSWTFSRSGIRRYILHKAQDSLAIVEQLKTGLRLLLWQIERIAQFHAEWICDEVLDGAKQFLQHRPRPSAFLGSHTSYQHGICHGVKMEDKSQAHHLCLTWPMIIYIKSSTCSLTSSLHQLSLNVKMISTWHYSIQFLAVIIAIQVVSLILATIGFLMQGLDMFVPISLFFIVSIFTKV